MFLRRIGASSILTTQARYYTFAATPSFSSSSSSLLIKALSASPHRTPFYRSLHSHRLHSTMSQQPTTNPPAASATDVTTPAAVAATAATATSPSTSGNFYTPIFPAALLDPLLAMDFPRNRCIRALHATGGVSIDSAVQWLFDHAEESGEIDTELKLQHASTAAAAGAASASSASLAAASSSASTAASSTILAGTPLKLVLLVRTDLSMRQGKIAAQCAHAAVGTLLDIQHSSATAQHKAMLRNWIHDGQAKIALAIKSEAEMMTLEKAARQDGIHTHIVADAGRTQVEAGSQTVLAIGPAPIAQIDKITGHLKLL